ncbi:MAG: ribonuclease III [Helicobacteraceae bacterium]|jgi:ribonuclease-3|nr:ribonuclease III [Helicobacteraceae bacterium]
MDEKRYAQLENRLGYMFNNRGLLQMALTHRSRKTEENNERLEFLGDAVLDLIVGEEMFTLFPQASEGELTKLRASLVSEKSLSCMAKELNLSEHLLLSNAEERSNGRAKPSILANAYEALIGAIYLDGGLLKAKECVLRLIHCCFGAITLERTLDDWKTRLQELTQARFGVVPEYRVLKATGPDHKKTFEVEISVQGTALAVGIGTNKKAAQRSAAHIAFQDLTRNDDE